jgi:hypothetical protein
MVTPELAEFLTRHIDVQVGTRDAELRPHSVRASAIRPAGDQHVIVFLPEIGAQAVQRDLKDNGQVAIFLGRPPDFRAYQIKGTLAEARPANEDERAFIAGHWDSFLESMDVIGIKRPIFSHWPIWPAVAVRIRVTAVFSQTPGPGAGGPVP